MIEFFAANWLWIVFVVAILTMHRRGCGSHGHRTDEQHERAARGKRDEMAAR